MDASAKKYAQNVVATLRWQVGQSVIALTSGQVAQGASSVAQAMGFPPETAPMFEAEVADILSSISADLSATDAKGDVWQNPNVMRELYTRLEKAHPGKGFAEKAASIASTGVPAADTAGFVMPGAEGDTAKRAQRKAGKDDQQVLNTPSIWVERTISDSTTGPEAKAKILQYTSDWAFSQQFGEDKRRLTPEFLESVYTESLSRAGTVRNVQEASQKIATEMRKTIITRMSKTNVGDGVFMASELPDRRVATEVMGGATTEKTVSRPVEQTVAQPSKQEQPIKLNPNNTFSNLLSKATSIGGTNDRVGKTMFYVIPDTGQAIPNRAEFVKSAMTDVGTNPSEIEVVIGDTTFVIPPYTVNEEDVPNGDYKSYFGKLLSKAEAIKSNDRKGAQRFYVVPE
jgi:hypothetical protein